MFNQHKMIKCACIVFGLIAIFSIETFAEEGQKTKKFVPTVVFDLYSEPAAVYSFVNKDKWDSCYGDEIKNLDFPPVEEAREGKKDNIKKEWSKCSDNRWITEKDDAVLNVQVFCKEDFPNPKIEFKENKRKTQLLLDLSAAIAAVKKKNEIKSSEKDSNGPPPEFPCVTTKSFPLKEKYSTIVVSVTAGDKKTKAEEKKLELSKVKESILAAKDAIEIAKIDEEIRPEALLIKAEKNRQLALKAMKLIKASDDIYALAADAYTQVAEKYANDAETILDGLPSAQGKVNNIASAGKADAGKADENKEGSPVEIIAGPAEHLFLSIDLPVNKVESLKYDPASGSVVPKDTPSAFYAGVNWMVGDVQSSYQSWEKGFVFKAMAKVSKNPLESFGVGIGYRLNNIELFDSELNKFTVFAGHFWTKEDRVVGGVVKPNDVYGRAWRVGVSYGFDGISDWLGD